MFQIGNLLNNAREQIRLLNNSNDKNNNIIEIIMPMEALILKWFEFLLNFTFFIGFT